jgi:predicted dehydrogenase
VTPAAPYTPTLGFLGAGRIGRHRLECIARSGAARISAVADPEQGAARDACVAVMSLGGAPVMATSLDELLALGVDGVVIATPSASHAEQAIAALEHGAAVFCQKPLARTAAETRRVVDAARAADRLLAVDLSYRFTDAMRRISALVGSGALGTVYAVDLVFHNAYGPDRPWFHDARLSGGGCVIDLGIHLVDLALWTLDFPRVDAVTSRLFADGMPLGSPDGRVEDYAVARLDLEGGTTVQLACSWNLSAGRDAVIAASFYGTRGGAAMHNVEGSFHHLLAERFTGTATERLSEPLDEWGGRAAVDWARRLAEGEGFDPEVEHLVAVAGTLDRIYGR